jgi:hypothetical protein
MTTAKHRIEHDLLGNLEVPVEAYYGVHTLRAVENFPITGTPISIYPDLSLQRRAVRSGHRNAVADHLGTSASCHGRIVGSSNPTLLILLSRTTPVRSCCRTSSVAGTRH